MAAGFTQTSGTSGTGISLPYADTTYLGGDFFLKRPDLLPKVVQSWDNRGFADLLMLNGQEMLTKSEIISNYEQGPLFRSVAFATVTNGSAGAATVTLTADSHTTVGSIAGGPTARSPLMERNIITLPNRKEVYVQSKSKITGGTDTTYVLVKSDNTNDTSFNVGTYLAGLLSTAPTQRFAVTSTASAERSSEPLEGLESPLIRYTGGLQIFRTHSEITGSAAGDEYEIDLTAGMADGYGPGTYWYSKQRMEQFIVHRTWMGMQFMFGKGGKFVDADGKPVQTTTGLEGYVRSYGNTYDYTVGGFQASDLDAICGRIKSIFGPRDYVWPMGYALYAQVEKVITALVPQGSIRYNELGSTDLRKKFVSFGINGFNYQGINFHLQESPTFSHPELLGLAGYDYASQGVLIPYQKTQVESYDNGYMEKISVDSVMIRYKEGINRSNRRMIEYDRGINIHGIDTTKHERLSHEGFQATRMRCFIWVERAAS